MARNELRNTHCYSLDPLLDGWDQELSALEESTLPVHAVDAVRLSVTLVYVRRMRDTLLQIAKNQGGVPSHTAQAVLADVGVEVWP